MDDLKMQKQTLKKAYKKTKRKHITPWKILAIICAVVMIVSIPLSILLQKFDNTMAARFGGSFWELENEDTNAQYYTSDFNSAEEMVDYGLALTQQVEAEGAALLMNNNNALPLAADAKVSTFSNSSVNLVYGGTGSGNIDASTADTLRPALQIIKTKPGNKIVSSCFIMVRPAASGENEVLAMADCAINIKPTEDELVEIGIETAKTAKVFGIDPKVAFLSYSTLGSGKGEDVDKMRNACEKAKAEMPNTPIGGEFQFDAAVSPAVAKTKHITDAVGGHANTFIFPDINAGNIGYKIAQRLGSFDAYGPILLGLNAPINDLSRGCNAQEVYSMAIITAALA